MPTDSCDAMTGKQHLLGKSETLAFAIDRTKGDIDLLRLETFLVFGAFVGRTCSELDL